VCISEETARVRNNLRNMESIALVLARSRVCDASDKGSFEAANRVAADVGARRVGECLYQERSADAQEHEVKIWDRGIEERDILTILGGPALPTAASWICVAVAAILLYSPVTPLSVML